jgi:hypothetical protein
MTKTYIPRTNESRAAWRESLNNLAVDARTRVCASCGEFALIDAGHSSGVCDCGAIVH